MTRQHKTWYGELTSQLSMPCLFTNGLQIHNVAENVGSKNPNLIEGDMILSNEQIRRVEKEKDVDSSRKRASSRVRLWPYGNVVYMIDSSLSKYSVITKAFVLT